MKKNKDEWDYSLQAKYYSKRPNYSEIAIKKMMHYFNFCVLSGATDTWDSGWADVPAHLRPCSKPWGRYGLRLGASFSSWILISIIEKFCIAFKHQNDTPNLNRFRQRIQYTERLLFKTDRTQFIKTYDIFTARIMVSLWLHLANRKKLESFEAPIM